MYLIAASIRTKGSCSGMSGQLCHAQVSEIRERCSGRIRVWACSSADFFSPAFMHLAQRTASVSEVAKRRGCSQTNCFWFMEEAWSQLACSESWRSLLHDGRCQNWHHVGRESCNICSRHHRATSITTNPRQDFQRTWAGHIGYWGWVGAGSLLATRSSILAAVLWSPNGIRYLTRM